MKEETNFCVLPFLRLELLLCVDEVVIVYSYEPLLLSLILNTSFKGF